MPDRGLQPRTTKQPLCCHLFVPTMLDVHMSLGTNNTSPLGRPSKKLLLGPDATGKIFTSAERGLCISPFYFVFVNSFCSEIQKCSAFEIRLTVFQKNKCFSTAAKPLIVTTTLTFFCNNYYYILHRCSCVNPSSGVGAYKIFKKAEVLLFPAKQHLKK